MICPCCSTWTIDPASTAPCEVCGGARAIPDDTRLCPTCNGTRMVQQPLVSGLSPALLWWWACDDCTDGRAPGGSDAPVL